MKYSYCFIVMDEDGNVVTERDLTAEQAIDRHVPQLARDVPPPRGDTGFDRERVDVALVRRARARPLVWGFQLSQDQRRARANRLTTPPLD